MIVVRETGVVDAASVAEHSPFECYGFVCDARSNARRLTFALAKAFQVRFASFSAEEMQEIPLSKCTKFSSQNAVHSVVMQYIL